MNDQSLIMNQQQMMSQPQMVSQSQVMNPVQPQILSQNPVPPHPPPPPPPQVLNPVQSQMIGQNQSQILSHSQAMNQQTLLMMNQRSYQPWPQQPSMDPNKKFQNQQNPLKFNFNNFVPSKARSNKNWKGKNINTKDSRRMEKPMYESSKPMSNKPNIVNSALMSGGAPSGTVGYKPPSLNELQTQNRMKARKYYHPKKKFNNRFAPYAPRNTTSFIIRAKKSGGIAELVSPCPVTPAVLPTPIFSPSREMLGDMAKEEWGVDGYGSMKGLIRLRSPGNEAEGHEDDEEEEGNGSSESDVEEHVEVERRLDHDLSRFEMIYPSYAGVGGDCGYANVLENRVDDQDSHIAQLEEENLTLKERLYLMERELGDVRRRLQFLERQHGHGRSAMVVEDVNEEVVENVSDNEDNENESDGGSDIGAIGGDNIEEVVEYVAQNEQCKNINNDVEESNDVCMEEIAPGLKTIMKDEIRDRKAGISFVANDQATVQEDVAKDGGMRDGPVNTDAVMVNKDEPMGEEVGNEVVLEQRIGNGEEEEEEISKGVDTGNEIVHDKVVIREG